jgi:glycosyltransferase involved in cell wall biosynthesis
MVVATGAATAKRVAQLHPQLPVEIVVPGADRLHRAPRALPPASGRGVTFLFVGSVIARKRVHLLLDAFEPVARMGATLVLLGDPARDPEYARAIAARTNASAALRTGVVHAGVASDEALADAMAAADALVLPSSLEGYGMALGEALHAGLPVIASREVAEAAGVCRHGGVAVLGEPPSWGDTLARFVRDSALRDAMSGAARASVMPRWSHTTSAFRAALIRATSRP